MKKFYRGKKVLITGHTGFKGSWLSKILLGWGAEVVGISIPPKSSPNLFEALNLTNKVKSYTLDVVDFKSVQAVFAKERPDIVFHLAAQPLVRVSYDDPMRTFAINVMGTLNILEAARKEGFPKSLVIATTDKVYRNIEQDIAYREEDALGGRDPYSASKSAADIIAQSYSSSFFESGTSPTLVSIGRSGNVIGGGDWEKDRIVPDVVRALYETKKPIIVRNPTAVRPWQFVLEPLYGYLTLAKGLYEGDAKFVGPWNFGPDEANFVSVEELVKTVIQIAKRGEYKVIPESGKHEAGLLKIDSSKAHKILSWHPRFSLEETLRATIEWYEAFYEKKDSLERLSEKQIDNFFS